MTSLTWSCRSLTSCKCGESSKYQLSTKYTLSNIYHVCIKKVLAEVVYKFLVNYSNGKYTWFFNIIQYSSTILYGRRWMVGIVHELNSSSGIIHLTVLNKPRCAFWTTQSAINEFLNLFSNASLSAWCIQSNIAENWLQLQCCSFGGNA